LPETYTEEIIPSPCKD